MHNTATQEVTKTRHYEGQPTKAKPSSLNAIPNICLTNLLVLGIGPKLHCLEIEIDVRRNLHAMIVAALFQMDHMKMASLPD